MYDVVQQRIAAYNQVGFVPNQRPQLLGPSRIPASISGGPAKSASNPTPDPHPREQDSRSCGFRGRRFPGSIVHARLLLEHQSQAFEVARDSTKASRGRLPWLRSDRCSGVTLLAPALRCPETDFRPAYNDAPTRQATCSGRPQGQRHSRLAGLGNCTAPAFVLPDGSLLGLRRYQNEGKCRGHDGPMTNR